MTRKRLIIALTIAVLLIIIIGIGLFLFFRTTPTTPSQSAETNQVTPTNTTVVTTTSESNGTVTPNPTNTTPVAAANLQPTKDDLRIISTARSFTERYGSYSTDTHYANIESSRSFMTDAMSAQADKIIAAGQASGTTFLSVATQAVNVTVTDYSAGASGATVQVDTRQTTTQGQAAPTTKNATVRLTLKKIGNTWKVDTFQWL